MEITAFDGHDHSACVQHTLATAEARCSENGLRLTEIRRKVLELLLIEHKALGAYDLLERLAAEGWSRQPPVVYRALAFLTENGLAHKVERLNAYIACAHPDERHAPVFLICTRCDRVAEGMAHLDTALGDVARETGFTVERAAIEAVGVCPACRQTEDAA